MSQQLDSGSRTCDGLGHGRRIGRYEIIRLVGAGGMGEVYLARDDKLDRSVAIKVLNERYETNEVHIDRFVREAKAASALNHPNILTIYEIGEIENFHYIASEFVDGKTLREVLAERKLSLLEILDFATQIAGALAAAHEAGIIHRDIKPENIILRPDGYIKILDFGLAKLTRMPILGQDDKTLRQTETAAGLILGTVTYMSPEQARGEPIDERTDIFSLGVLIYELVCGRTPFGGASASDSLANLIAGNAPALSDLVPNVPAELQRIVSGTLRKNRDERYQTMKSLLADLKKFREKNADAFKSERSAFPDTERETAVMHAFTKGGERKSVTQVIRSRPLLLITGFAFIFVTTSLLAWYWRRPPASAPNGVRSLAVLPLRSIDSVDNFLGLGIADAVISKISQTGSLTVRPTSAVRRYVNEDTDALTAANQLSTDAVLEGSFQRSGGRLRVSVNLLRTSDGVSLWTDSFDMNSADVFKIEDTVAKQVASQLKIQLDPAQQARMQRKYTSDPVAYEYYVKGIYSLDQRGYGAEALPQMLTTIDLFKKAIEDDPNYALAHAQLAQAYAWTAVMVESTNPEWEKLANQEIERSQALDPQLAESHLARAFLLWSVYNGYQNEAAVREVLFAQKLNPGVGHDHLAAWFAHMGLEDAASREIQKEIEIDPTSHGAKELSVVQYFLSGRYDEYLEASRKIDPDADPGAWYLLGKGRLDEAETALGRYVAEGSDARDVPGYRGLLYALRGDHRAAEKQVPAALTAYPPNDQGRHHSLYTVACIYALIGNSKESVKYLRETAASGYPNFPLFERDHYLDHIRQAPEFARFMDEMRSLNGKYTSEFQ